MAVRSESEIKRLGATMSVKRIDAKLDGYAKQVEVCEDQIKQYKKIRKIAEKRERLANQ